MICSWLTVLFCISFSNVLLFFQITYICSMVEWSSVGRADLKLPFCQNQFFKSKSRCQSYMICRQCSYYGLLNFNTSADLKLCNLLYWKILKAKQPKSESLPNGHEISQIFDKNAQKEGISCLKKTNEFCPFGFVFKFSTASGTTL